MGCVIGSCYLFLGSSTRHCFLRQTFLVSTVSVISIFEVEPVKKKNMENMVYCILTVVNIALS